MADDLDRYDVWYSRKLWQLLPGVYRAEDSDDFDKAGPLREIVERVGAQAAVVRRSIDRLWEDQSIETCDDWLIDYIGDLLSTNLVASLDARGRRVDVGKTIYYRRRKGTVGLLEELAGDITGWRVRVVEFFRHMSRTRHGLDPAIGVTAPATTPRGQLQREQGLVGRRTGTGAGGFADLRNVHGASLTSSAFDEYFHTADVRRGRGPTGWYGIPHLGVFVWRLKSFQVIGVTAVQDAKCRNQYTFDPTGRDIPLFAAGDHVTGDQWVSPKEHEVPGPISRPLLQAAFAELYRDPDHSHSLAVHRKVGGAVLDYLFVPASEVSQDPRTSTGRFAIDPTRGRIIAPVGVTDGEYRVDYHYGFASEIGAGPYDRRVARDPRAPAPPTPPPPTRVRSGTGLDTAIAALVPAGTAPTTGRIQIDDSLTYAAIADIPRIGAVEIAAANRTRPLVRSTKATWTFEGNGPDATLVLDGLFVSRGTEIVLAGELAHVKIRCCTFDPGTWEAKNSAWKQAADYKVAEDGPRLAPTRLRIAGKIRTLEIERSILGPISDSGTFTAETLTIRDSIIQAASPTEPAFALTNGALALSRCTVLGAVKAHRIDVSESILHDVATVDDVQHGCVRFSAWAAGSMLPRKYESVKIAPREDLFVSRELGHPAMAQLIATVGSAIAEGAEDGSEMGAFAREKSSIKERSILIKYQEYLPLGIEPVIVHAT